MTPATEKQLQYLRSLGEKRKAAGGELTSGEASRLIEKALRRRKYRDLILWCVVIFYLLACAIALLAGVFMQK